MANSIIFLTFNLTFAQEIGGVYKLQYKEKSILTTGSCVAYSKTKDSVLYMTAEHLFWNEGVDHEIIVSGKKHKIKRIKKYFCKDLQESIVVISTPLLENVKTYPISKRILKKNDKVKLVGFPNGVYNWHTATVHEVRSTGLLTSGIPPSYGASGGAVLYDNQIVGIIAGVDQKRNKGVHLNIQVLENNK